MHPTATRANRSSVQSSIPQTFPPTSSVIQQQQQQQQILYGPVANPTLNLQPCGTGLHPSCIYPGTQRNPPPTNLAPLYVQGKSTRWPGKNKPARNQQYYEQQQQHQHVQQQLSYNQKPLILYDQPTNNPPSIPSGTGTGGVPTASFLIASSTYAHGSFSGDQYNNNNVALIPQTFYKPPDVQTYCLVQDRQNFQEPTTSHTPYYNVSTANAYNLQTVNGNASFQFANLNPYQSGPSYPSNHLSGPIQSVHASQIYPNPSGNIVFGAVPREKPQISSSSGILDVSGLKGTKSKVSTCGASNNSQIGTDEWPTQVVGGSSNDLFKSSAEDETNRGENVGRSLEKMASNVSAKIREERCSDESLASFDFTIEAEKMVSALCNTSSNEIGKEEARNEKVNGTPLFNGAGDTASNKNAWFTEFCTDYGCGTSIAVQTDGPCNDRTQFPELLRKIVYWGCTEAEIVLNNSSQSNLKSDWLRNLSSATKTAVTKSSTCFPIFAGDRVFVNDLINALLRISNGWLILDNYLNKQHYPGLDDKFDTDLSRCFRLWEESTHELLNQIVETFVKLEENTGQVSGYEQKTDSFAGSFPGDVSAYTNRDLFDPTATVSKEDSFGKKTGQEGNCNPIQSPSDGLKNRFGLYNDGIGNREKQTCHRESKLRSKWTVTENLETIDNTKSIGDVFTGHTDSGGQSNNNRFRGRGNSCTGKLETSTRSLNAEFFHLRSKILTESGSQENIGKQWTLKEKKQDYNENKIAHESVDPIYTLQRRMDDNYESKYSQKCLSRMESSFINPSINVESVYFNNDRDHFYPCYAVCPSYALDYANAKCAKGYEQNDRGNKTNVDLVYIGKSSSSQLELATVPKDKITLLSQIEPSIPEKSSEEMTANLSAWFASMRNTEDRQTSFVDLPETNADTVVSRMSSRQDIPKGSTMDLSNCIRQLQIDANRQFQTLRNMQAVQTAPWNAYNLINDRVQVQQIPDEYDSSEDVRVYMKPGSYNVPKKRHQRRSNRRLDNSSSRNLANNHRNPYCGNKEKTFCVQASSTPISRPGSTQISNVMNVSSSSTVKLPFPATPVVPPPTFSLENSPRILKRPEGTSPCTLSEDITWKAACASAEILLEALNVKEDSDSKRKEIERSDASEKYEENCENDGMDTPELTNQEKFENSSRLKIMEDDNDGGGGVSSYEASEDDSSSTYHFSPKTIAGETFQFPGKKNGSNKMNVKTDSWLIKTLNNANITYQQKQEKMEGERKNSESSNSSITETDQTTGSPLKMAAASTTSASISTATSTTLKTLQQTVCSRKSSNISLNNNQQSALEETERVAGKATYSETVRRCATLSATFTEKKDLCKKGKLNMANASTVCSTVVPIPGRKCQRKDYERSYYLLHNKSRKCSGKKSTKCSENVESRMEGTSKTVLALKQSKKKENNGCIEFLDGKFGGKNTDRGWSIWYSSKRKQSLSPLALSKLETIHQTVWQMDEAEIFKCPSSGNNNGSRSSAYTIEDYCKVVKNPMFLETVEYKLKNRVYHKVEHVIRDFRRIVYNSKLYHKDDHDRVRTIEILSKRLEELFEEHFSSWDFENISGSPRESSSIFQQKQMTGRYSHSKKSPPSSAPENV